MEYMNQLTIFLDVVIATVLTAAIGAERESANKPAGIRTNMIVGGASCLIVAITIPLIDFINQYNPQEILRVDPIRTLEALVVGVSFIGAGTILKHKGKERVEGLTTAATLLYCAGIGICTALKQYVLAICVTLLIVFVNYMVRLIVRKFLKAEPEAPARPE